MVTRTIQAELLRLYGDATRSLPEPEDVRHVAQNLLNSLSDEDAPIQFPTLPQNPHDPEAHARFAVDYTKAQTMDQVARDLTRRTTPGSLLEAQREREWLIKKGSFLITGAWSLKPILRERLYIMDTPMELANRTHRIPTDPASLQKTTLRNFAESAGAPITALTVITVPFTTYSELAERHPRDDARWKNPKHYTKHEPHQAALSVAGATAGLRMLELVEIALNGAAPSDIQEQLHYNIRTAVLLETLAGLLTMPYLNRGDTEFA